MRQPTQKYFLKNVSNHSMSVLLDNGVYRHLSFSNNGSFNQKFDIVTWPGFLAYSGDMGCFVFSRLDDMFEFFRNDKDKKELQINPSYWGEKLEATERTNGFKEYSPERFESLVNEKVDEWIEELKEEYDSSEEIADALRESIKKEVLNYAHDDEYKAHEVLRDFTFYFNKRANAPKNGTILEFHDTWEWELKDYTYRFIWCCYAIVWAIQKFDALGETK
jgi:hypothetical protein